MKKAVKRTKTPIVMQVIPTLGAGGAEQGCIDVCAELVRAGALALVVSNGGSRIHEIARAGGTHINMPVDSKNPLVVFKNARKLRHLIRKYDVDILHARSRAPAWSCWRACGGTDAKLVTTCHAPYNIENEWKRRYNAIMTKGERVIAISHFVAEYLRRNYKIDARKIRVVHRGVALEKFHPACVTPERLIKLSKAWRIPDGVGIIMMPARLTRWKGHDVLIDAIAALNRTDVFCIMIGADQGRVEYRREMEEKIKGRGLEGQVRIVDHCDDMPAAYMMATVVVSASTDPEGFGRVPVEAQAMGRPVIASDHGGVRETIVRGETGWLIPPGDPAALSRAIAEALALSQNQRAILATRAMTHIAQNFTREKMVGETLDIYAEILREKFMGGVSWLHEGETRLPPGIAAE